MTRKENDSDKERMTLSLREINLLPCANRICSHCSLSVRERESFSFLVTYTHVYTTARARARARSGSLSLSLLNSLLNLLSLPPSLPPSLFRNLSLFCDISLSFATSLYLSLSLAVSCSFSCLYSLFNFRSLTLSLSFLLTRSHFPLLSPTLARSRVHVIRTNYCLLESKWKINYDLLRQYDLEKTLGNVSFRGLRFCLQRAYHINIEHITLFMTCSCFHSHSLTRVISFLCCPFCSSSGDNLFLLCVPLLERTKRTCSFCHSCFGENKQEEQEKGTGSLQNENKEENK